MKINAKYVINGEKVYTAAQIKELLEYAAQCRLDMALEWMTEDNRTDASLRLAADYLDYSNDLVSFSKALDDYLA